MIGTLTEGDIRRYLINKGSILDYVDKCFNKKFTYAFINSSYESLLKLFDEKIKYLPILDKKMKLVEILDKNKLLFKKIKVFLIMHDLLLESVLLVEDLILLLFLKMTMGPLSIQHLAYTLMLL